MRTNVAWRLATALGLLVLVFSSATPTVGQYRPAAPAPPPFDIAVAAAANGPRAVYLYKTDSSSATAFQSLLEASGYTVSLIAIAADGSAPIIPSATDVFLIGADTESGGAWSGNPALSTALIDSSKPVVGLGEGGRAFFARAGLAIGSAQRIKAVSSLAAVSDYPTSRVVYEAPNSIAAAPDQMLDLYSGGVPVVAIPLADRLPDGDRYAVLRFASYLPLVINATAGAGAAAGELAAARELAAAPAPAAPSAPSASSGAGLFPIVRENGRYVLWGYAGVPNAMTATGQRLFLNLLAAQTRAINLALGARAFSPGAGVDAGFTAALQATPLPNLHAYVQVDHPLSDGERVTLEGKGIRLLEYIGGVNYTGVISKLVGGSPFDPNDGAMLALVRAVAPISPTDKLEPAVASGAFSAWVDNGDGTVNLGVHFFGDVPDSESEAIIAASTVSYQATGAGLYTVVIDIGAIATLSSNDRVRWIQQIPAPITDRLGNDVARDDLNVDTAQQINTASSPPFYTGLSGSGVVVSVHDSGVFSPSKTSHPDLAGRVIRTANDTDRPNSGGHGTHVAGIVGASGAQSASQCPYGAGSCSAWQMRGMAPNVQIAAFTSGGDDLPTYKSAYVDYGAKVSTHSYGWTCVDYIGSMATIDRLIRGDATSGGTAIPARSFTGSSGNEGDGPQYCTGHIGYFSLGNVSKNAIIVGGVDRGTDGNLTAFSSRGPTWDNRIKPDVMATSCMYSLNIDTDGYSGKCGTSMSTPAVAGVAALVYQQYQRTFGSATNPLPSTIKALLIGTATDLVHATASPGDFNDPDLCPGGGSGNPNCAVLYYRGPDYATGYGMVNAALAVDTMQAKNWIEGSVSPAQASRTYTVSVSAQKIMTFTLAWDDEPGDPATAQTSAKLVNDLDLTLTDPNGVTHFPWVLAPLPTNAVLSGTDPITRAMIVPAFRGVDRRNNVEQVVVTATGTLTSGVWTIRVNAFALPNNHTQRFSLVGDFRSLHIMDPVQGAAADAGDPSAPGQVIVRLGARSSAHSGNVALTGVTKDDFTASVSSPTGATTGANILSGLKVGDQFWLVVSPEPVAAAGYYTLSVTWTGHSSAAEKRALLFLESVPRDRVIVLDHSGSMADFDKMGSAQNAARLFVDQTAVGDSIGVVAFETSSTIPFSLTLNASSGSAVLNAAKSAISAQVPAGATAMGQGLINGQNELERLNHADADWHIILLTDGMENVAPMWADATVSGRLLPSKTIIDTVAVGPPEAAEQGLLASIAAAKHGHAYNVSESTGGALAATRSPDAPAVFDDFPRQLPNKLADVYKSIDEDIRHFQRLWDQRGIANCSVLLEKGVAYKVDVEQNLSHAIFAVNFAAPGYPMLDLYPPGSSTPLKPTDPGVVRRQDSLHDTWLIDKPDGGGWTVVLRAEKGCVTGTEYMLWLSADSAVTMQVFYGADARDTCTRRPVPILAFLADHRAIPEPQAVVTISVLGPDVEAGIEGLQLYDDGEHGDGQKQDGIYGNLFIRDILPGAYAVKAYGIGTSNFGEHFERRRLSSFYVRPCVAYIYNTDIQSAASYEGLLENNGFAVDLLHTTQTTATQWSQYNLVVVGNDTGQAYTWFGGPSGAAAIVQYGSHVIGNGEGGSSFFHQLGLNIDWGGAGVNSNSTSAQPVDTAHAAWNTPYPVPIVGRQVQLYAKATIAVETYGPAAVPILRIGRDPASQLYFPIAQQTDDKGNILPYLLWGWYASPRFMTTAGQWTYVNLAWYMRR